MKIKTTDYEVKHILRIMREWTELTQKELGESINLSESAIQGYESGRRHCLLDTFFKIAKTHGFTITIEK